jgi:hypothetical protein
MAILFVLMLLNTAAWGQAFHCIPSCDNGDIRFLSIPSAGLSSLAEQEINVQIVIPGDLADFELGIFDGDTGLTSPPVNDTGSAAPVDHWDLNAGRLAFELFADPLGDGSGTVLAASFDGQTMPDNDWFARTIANIDDAQSTDGAFRYNLRIRLLAGALAISNFKLRVLAASIMSIVQNEFGFQAGAFSIDDLFTLFPEFPDLGITPYDGSFRFFSFVEEEVSEFVIIDGDFDHGSLLNGTADTDDPDTPNDSLPSWFVPGTRFEGVNLSSPPDDRGPPMLTRAPSVSYSVATPDHLQTFANTNPSGSQEWEQFRISTEPFDRNTMDYSSASLPGGIYTIDITGLDVQNFSAWHAGRIECATSEGAPCPQIPHFTIGDSVFEDRNQNGIRDGDEAGIVGVLVNLLNTNARLLDQTVTDSDGRYSFTVTNGAFSAAVNDKNFMPTGPAGALGDTVWLDADRNGSQDVDEPGISNATVKLFDAGADGLPGGGDDRLLTSTITDVSGLYRFNDLAPGIYFVAVEPGTVPKGLSLPPAEDPTPTRTITTADTFLDLDFGYVDGAGAAIIGGQIWLDRNGTPHTREPNEPGISDVTVHLCDLNIGPCVELSDYIASTRTRGGKFLFTGLDPGTYSVEVTDLVGKLKGLTLTTPLPSPSPAFSLDADEAVLDANFGYRGDGLNAVHDSVWLDENRDGIRNTGEVGLSGVTANLVDAMGEVVATSVSETAGQLTFSGLPAGTYRLVITDLDGVLIDLIPTSSAPIRGLDVVISNGDVTGENFGYNLHGQLASYYATTESPVQDVMVSGADVLTLDFGYHNACGTCDGKVTELTLQYLGTRTDAHIAVVQRHPGTVIYDAVVQPGQSFDVAGMDRKGTLGTEIKVYVDGQLSAKFHTSCSQPIGPGLRVGDFKVIAGSSRQGGALCPIDGTCQDDDDSSDDHGSSSDDNSSDDHRSDGTYRSQDHRSDRRGSDDDSSVDEEQCRHDKHG